MGKPKKRYQSYVGLVSPRPVLQINSIEGAAGILLVATDFSLYWAVLKAAGMRARPGNGHLFDTIA